MTQFGKKNYVGQILTDRVNMTRTYWILPLLRDAVHHICMYCTKAAGIVPGDWGYYDDADGLNMTEDIAVPGAVAIQDKLTVTAAFDELIHSTLRTIGQQVISGIQSEDLCFQPILVRSRLMESDSMLFHLQLEVTAFRDKLAEANLLYEVVGGIATETEIGRVFIIVTDGASGISSIVTLNKWRKTDMVTEGTLIEYMKQCLDKMYPRRTNIITCASGSIHVYHILISDMKASSSTSAFDKTNHTATINRTCNELQ